MTSHLFRFFWPVTLAILFSALFANADVRAQGNSEFRPAMVNGGSNPIASHLHYPPKEIKSKTEGAVVFYCEVDANGKATHVQTVSKNGHGFNAAVLRALSHGRFTPAAVNGRAVTVMLGGTVLFLMPGGHPTIAVSLSSADQSKAAALSNYIQPQMISSNADFRRKIFQRASKVVLYVALRPSAEAMAEVDAKGNLTSTKLIFEKPAKSGYGDLLVKAFDGAKFIPAFSNGRPVTGEYNLPFDYTYIRDPDAGRPIDSIINQGQ